MAYQAIERRRILEEHAPRGAPEAEGNSIPCPGGYASQNRSNKASKIEHSSFLPRAMPSVLVARLAFPAETFSIRHLWYEPYG